MPEVVAARVARDRRLRRAAVPGPLPWVEVYRRAARRGSAECSEAGASRPYAAAATATVRRSTSRNQIQYRQVASVYRVMIVMKLTV